MPLDSENMIDYAQALAFSGNSLLAPMNQTETVGLDPEFWKAFPGFGDEGVRAAISGLQRYARSAQRRAAAGFDPVTDVSVEYTKLFVGPPKPAAPPWETFYSAADEATVDVGFGRATAEMQRLLAQRGLRISNENNQYADHMGIELLYASELVRGLAAGKADAAEKPPEYVDITGFIEEHPLAWVDRFHSAVNKAEPEGYITLIVELAKRLLEMA